MSVTKSKGRSKHASRKARRLAVTVSTDASTGARKVQLMQSPICGMTLGRVPDVTPNELAIGTVQVARVPRMLFLASLSCIYPLLFTRYGLGV